MRHNCTVLLRWLGIGFFAVLGVPPVAGAPLGGQVIEVTGTCVIAAGATEALDWRPLRLGQEIVPGDRLVCGQSGLSLIRLPISGTEIRITPGEVYEIAHVPGSRPLPDKGRGARSAAINPKERLATGGVVVRPDLDRGPAATAAAVRKAGNSSAKEAVRKAGGNSSAKETVRCKALLKKGEQDELTVAEAALLRKECR